MAFWHPTQYFRKNTRTVEFVHTPLGLSFRLIEINVLIGLGLRRVTQSIRLIFLLPFKFKV